MDRNTAYSYRPSGGNAPPAYRPSGDARNPSTYRPTGDARNPSTYRPTGDARNPSTYRPAGPPPGVPAAGMNRQTANSYRPSQPVPPPTGGWRQTQTSNPQQQHHQPQHHQQPANGARDTAYTFDYRHTQDIADVNRQTAYTYRSDNQNASRNTAWTFRTQNTDPNRMTTATYKSSKGGKKRGRSSRFSMLSMDLMMGITPAVPEPPSVRVPTYYQEFNRKSRFSKYLSVNGPVWRPTGAGSDSQTNLHLGDIEEEGDYEGDDEEQFEAYSIYSPWQKRLIVIGNAFISFVGALTVQMYLPALNVLASELDVTNATINLTVTAFLIFQGISPLVFSGFTDVYGRRPGYIICFIVYVISNIVLALSESFSVMLALRCLQSVGTSTIMVLSQAAVADIVTSAERPQYIGITSIPTILGPSIGPVIGGALVDTLRWRSIFWFLAIYAGFTFLAVVVFMPETCRKIVGDGSVRPHRAYYTIVQTVKYSGEKEKPTENIASLEAAGGKDEGGVKFVMRMLFSAVALFGKLQLVLLITAAGLAFGAVYALSTAAPNIFYEEYGLTSLQVGLMYLPMAVGSILAVAIVGPGMNYNYRRHAALAGVSVTQGERMDLDNFPIEKARLQVAIPLLVLGVCTIAGFGWALEKHAPLGVICMLIFFFGISIVGINNAIQVLIVDIFFDQAGAALATNNFMKCALGAAASAVVKPMIDAIDLGYSFTVFAAMYASLIPLMMLIMWKGAEWRPRPNSS